MGVGSQDLCQPGNLALSYLAAGSSCSLTQCLTSVRSQGAVCLNHRWAAVQSPVQCEMYTCSLSCEELWCANKQPLLEVAVGAQHARE